MYKIDKFRKTRIIKRRISIVEKSLCQSHRDRVQNAVVGPSTPATATQSIFRNGVRDFQPVGPASLVPWPRNRGATLARSQNSNYSQTGRLLLFYFYCHTHNDGAVRTSIRPSRWSRIRSVYRFAAAGRVSAVGGGRILT